MKTIAQRLKHLRKLTRMTQTDLARELDCTLRYIQYLEAGKTAPKMLKIVTLAITELERKHHV